MTGRGTRFSGLDEKVEIIQKFYSVILEAFSNLSDPVIPGNNLP